MSFARADRVVASFATTALVIGVSLVSTVILARALGPEGRGLLLALTFWPALLTALFNLSLPEAAAFHVAQRATSKETANAFAGAALWFVAGLAVCGAALTLAALPFVVGAPYRAHLHTILIYAAAFAPISMFDLFFRAVLQGRGESFRLNAVRAAQPVVYLAMLAAAAMLSPPLEIVDVLAATVGSVLVSLALGLALTRIKPVAPTRAAAGPLLATGWKFHRANVLLYGAAELDKALVLALLATAQAGLYAVGAAISAIGAGVVLQSLGLMLMSDLSASADMADRRQVVLTTLRAAFAILIVVNLGAAATANWWLPWIFGEKFRPAIPAAIVLLTMGVFKGARQMIDKVLRASHHTRTGMLGEGAALIALLILAPIGAALGGLEGLALGVLGAQILSFALCALLAAKHFELAPLQLWPFSREVYAECLAAIKTRSFRGRSKA